MQWGRHTVHAAGREHVPTMADTPQGSLIVILKDSMKSTGQFPCTRGLGAGDTHTHAQACTHGPACTLTHMPTNNTHTPPTQRPHWLARAAWIWGMQPLGTRKHTRGLSQHRSICTSSLHTLVPGVLRGPPYCSREDWGCFLGFSCHFSARELSVAACCQIPLSP